MEPVSELLPAVYRKLAKDAVDEQALLLALWPAVAGERVAEKARAVRLFGRTLIVETLDPAWRRELAAITGLIVSRLNAAAGKAVVEDVQFRLARRPPRRAFTAAGTGDEAEAIADPHLRRLYRISRQASEGK
jgi:hypothetical protein